MIFQKSACIETLYTELPFLERFRAAKADGFDFVEFWSWTDKDLAAVRAAADAAGVGISGFNGDADFSLVDPTHKQKYLDFFDDDITLHIDAFWYGFAKLMQNVNGLYRLDMSGFNEYCEGVVETVTRSALDFCNAFGSKATMEFAADIETLTK